MTMTTPQTIQNFFAGVQYTCTGEPSRAMVHGWHQSPSPVKLNKGKLSDVTGLKPSVRQRAILTEQGEQVSRFTIGFEIEKNSFHRNAVREYPLFSGFERDVSCGLEAITNVLPLLPEGKWRNKVFDLFVQAEKILDSRFSPADMTLRWSRDHLSQRADLRRTEASLSARSRASCLPSSRRG